MRAAVRANALKARLECHRWTPFSWLVILPARDAILTGPRFGEVIRASLRGFIHSAHHGYEFQLQQA